MKKIITTAAIFCSALLGAQNNNLNQTVQVTNDYQAKVKEVDKPSGEIAIPDSLYKFDLNFNYEGFENPYKGSDYFNPFLTDLDIAGRKYDGKRLFLKFGAGYTPAPVVQAAYTMKQKGVFKCGLHASHQSYWGPFYVNYPYEKELLPFRNDSKAGYESNSFAGFDGRFDWSGCAMLLNLDYEGVHYCRDMNSYNSTLRSYNGVRAELMLSTLLSSPLRFNMGIDYSFGGDRIDTPDSKLYYEHGTFANLSLICAVGSHSFVGVDGDVDYTYGFQKNASDFYYAYDVVATPHYCYDNRKVHIDVGVGLMFAGGIDEDGMDLIKTSGNTRFFDIFPKLKFQWNAVDGAFEVFADASLGGGLLGARKKAMKYGYYLNDSKLSIVKNFNADFGFRGNIVDAVQYKIYAGYDRDDNAPLFNVLSTSTVPDVVIVHDSFSSVVGGAEIVVRAGGFSLDGNVSYRHYFDKDMMAAAPPALLAGCDIKYDIMKRIGIGAGMSYTSEYRAGYYTVPQFFDLRAVLDYKVNSHWKLFVNGSNLLNNSCQTIPLISHKGICITGGAVLNF